MLKIHSFIGKGRLGNSHCVMVEPTYDPTKQTEYIRTSLEIAPSILVVLDNTEIKNFNRAGSSSKKNTGILNPKFFHKGKQVQFCGSGILAAAYYLDQKAHLPSTLPILANLPNIEVQLCFDRERSLYGFQAKLELALSTVAASNWTDVVNAQPIHAYHLGESYLLVELQSAQNIEQLKPNLALLCERSDRALIVTAKSEEQCDYVMRYFAPQYGNNEDAATGSANWFLMKYWAEKLGKTQLKGLQLSEHGGEFYGKISATQTALYGQVVQA